MKKQTKNIRKGNKIVGYVEKSADKKISVFVDGPKDGYPIGDETGLSADSSDGAILSAFVSEYKLAMKSTAEFSDSENPNKISSIDKIKKINQLTKDDFSMDKNWNEH